MTGRRASIAISGVAFKPHHCINEVLIIIHSFIFYTMSISCAESWHLQPTYSSRPLFLHWHSASRYQQQQVHARCVYSNTNECTFIRMNTLRLPLPGGVLTVVHILTATAITGLIQVESMPPSCIPWLARPCTCGIVAAASTAAESACTCLQSVIGGQPLLIVGVSEPITLIYG